MVPLNALAGLFVHVLQLPQKAELVHLGHVALDGSKIKASSSKHEAMSRCSSKRLVRSSSCSWHHWQR